MRLLLDTHVLLRWWADSPRLSTVAREAIATSDDVAISVATVWEIEVKRALGRLRAPSDLLAAVEAEDFELLEIAGAHVVSAARLPAHHRDPFDRMLVAQAVIEQRIVVSADAVLADYEVDRIPA